MRTTLRSLFLTFAKIGALTFGGGMAMFPILEREVVDRRGWATGEELLDFYAIGQCTPGIIAVNTATFVGYRERRTAGGIAATLGMVAPSFCIILLLATVLRALQGNPWVLKAFAGIRIAVCALILRSVVSLGRKAVVDAVSGAAIAAAVALNLLWGVSTVWIVLLAVAGGLLYHLARARAQASACGGGKEERR